MSATALKETSHLARELCEECGAVGFSDATEERARKELWRARHEAWETIHRAHPKKETLIVDAAVPISRYPEMVVVSAGGGRRAQGAIGYVFGHAGDGNLHVVLVGDPADKAEWGKLEDINRAIVEQAIGMGGTCTGEHGVGIGKRKFMQPRARGQLRAHAADQAAGGSQGVDEPGEDLLRRGNQGSGFRKNPDRGAAVVSPEP